MKTEAHLYNSKPILYILSVYNFNFFFLFFTGELLQNEARYTLEIYFSLCIKRETLEIMQKKEKKDLTSKHGICETYILYGYVLFSFFLSLVRRILFRKWYLENNFLVCMFSKWY